MKVLQCIVADDEPIARQIMEGYIKEMPRLELVASCKDAFEILQVLENKSVDILFLDINMPKLSGLSLLKTMQHRPHVIITTAYSEYAIEGFELAVVDYLLKPFSLERFIQAVLKVRHKQVPEETDSVDLKEAGQHALFVKSDKKLVRIELADVSYIEACGNYIKIHTDKMILTPETLSDFFARLPEQDFLRVHKSYVINFNKLKLIEGNQVQLVDNSKLPVGKLFKKFLLDKINKN